MERKLSLTEWIKRSFGDVSEEKLKKLKQSKDVLNTYIKYLFFLKKN